MKIGVSSTSMSQMEMTTLARWTIRPRLMAIPGVANVAIWGERDRQIQVLVDPERLAGARHDARRRRACGTLGDALQAPEDSSTLRTSDSRSHTSRRS